MQAIEITGHIYAVKESWNNEVHYQHAPFAPEFAPSTWLHVCEHKIVVEMPATFNPVAAEIEAIERENEQLRAEFNRQIGRNMERLAKLQAIKYTPAQEVEPAQVAQLDSLKFDQEAGEWVLSRGDESLGRFLTHDAATSYARSIGIFISDITPAQEAA